MRLPPKIATNEVARLYTQKMETAIAEKGQISRDDVVNLFRSAYDGKTQTVDKKSAEALAFIAEAFEHKMSKDARVLAHEFRKAYATDMMADPLTEEYKRQAAEQLAQETKDFRQYVREDRQEHREQSYEKFKENLQENRIETSEWQSLMLWLTTGRKQNPITN